MSTLWEGLSPPWRACIEQAWMAYRCGSLPIGAVIAGPSGEIVARGRNMGFQHDPSSHALAKSAIGHAELVALGKVKRPRSLHNSTVYCSIEPCPMCACALRMAYVGEVRYAARDPEDGGIRLLSATPYMRFHACRVLGPESAPLETLLAALVYERLLKWTAKRPGGHEWRKGWAKALPRAVALGAALRQRNALAGLAHERAPAHEMLEALDRECGALAREKEASTA